MKEIVIDIFKSNPIVINVLIGLTLMILESIIPILPSAIFIAVNNIVFGPVVGFIISYIGAVTGCIISYKIAEYNHEKLKNKKIIQMVELTNKTKFANMTLITAIPFTPAFLINIASGLADMTFKRFTLMILISKISLVYFWGYIGATLFESVTDATVLLKIGIILGITYLLAKIVMKEFKLK